MNRFALEVLTSGIWQMSSTIVASGDECLVVDPGYFPRELDDVARAARRRGEVRAVAFTHGHWDHVIGWQSFPEAAVWASASLAQAIADGSELAEKSLASARDFDGRWYVRREPPLRWPSNARALGEGERLRVGQVDVQTLLLPGHSPDGVGLLVEGVLLVGDYLSPCEIPFVDDLDAYRQTLLRLQALDLEQVIPGHGPILSRAEAMAIAAADLRYLDALARAADEGEREHLRAVTLPRAADVPGMRDHHEENVDIAWKARV